MNHVFKVGSDLFFVDQSLDMFSQAFIIMSVNVLAAATTWTHELYTYVDYAVNRSRKAKIST